MYGSNADAILEEEVMKRHCFSSGSPSLICTPNGHPCTTTENKFHFVMKVSNSLIRHPLQFFGHSKLTWPPFCKMISAKRMKLASMAREVFLRVSSLLM